MPLLLPQRERERCTIKNNKLLKKSIFYCAQILSEDSFNIDLDCGEGRSEERSSADFFWVILAFLGHWARSESKGELFQSTAAPASSLWGHEENVLDKA